MKQAIRLALDPNKHLKTHIMATVGPATKDFEVIKAMVESGVTFFRFNGAHIEKDAGPDHLSYEDAKKIAEHIRGLRRFFRQSIGIYFDLGGPKIRVKHVLSIQKFNLNENMEKDNWLRPSKGETVIIHAWNQQMEEEFKKDLEASVPQSNERNWNNRQFVQHFFSKSARTQRNELMLGNDITTFKGFDKNNPINLKDGWCRLKIKDKLRTKLICEVDYVDSKFEFREEGGANPYRHIFNEIITDKDKRDITEAVKMGADIISLSFVCSSYDANYLRNIINKSKEEIKNDKEFMKIQSEAYHRYIKEHQIPIFAKIETAYAVLPEEARKYAKEKKLNIPTDENWNPIRAIAEVFDGLMVARGDLAVEVEKYKVPELQRQIIKIAHLLNKPVIVATEMLESMRKGDASTRAEIMDINSAVHQEADILMLSGETANIKKGKPADVVREMRAAIKQAEDERLDIDKEKNFEALQKERENELSKNLMGSERERLLTISRLAQGNQVCVSARALGSEAIIASVKTGQAVQEIAYYRPNQKIMAITDDVLLAVRLLQYRGIYPVVMERPLKRTLDEFIDIVTEINDELGVPHPYLFSWNKISGNNDRRFIEFLKQNYSIDWVKKPKIEKIDEMTIKVSNGKNSLLLKLIDGEKKVSLEIDGGGTDEFIVIENGERSIYPANLFFRFPGLVRIRPEFSNGSIANIEDLEIPNSIHEFTLPTKPNSVPETERKYILSSNSFEKLEKALKNDAANWRHVRQHNFYFTDSEKEVLFNKKIMLRIRFEVLLKQKQPQQSPHDNIQIFFTFKRPSTASGISGEETRPEKQFEVTRELRDQIKFLDEEKPIIDFHKLPEFYISYILDRCNDELKEYYNKSENIKFMQIAHMTNYRFTFEMWNGFILELDKGKETNDYELEIELREDQHLSNQLDEYIHDKFCRLDIPIVRDSYFGWDEIPEIGIPKKKGRLTEFLNQDIGIDWVKTAKFEKIDNGRTIRISTKTKSLWLRLNDKKTKVYLKSYDGRTDDFIVKTENGKLNIYRFSYPTKVVRTLAWANKLPRSVLQPMEKIKEFLYKHHADSCEKCKMY